MAEWGFHGRRRELAKLLGRGRWFFLWISGRRRMGKTRLVQELQQPERRERVLDIQITDPDPAGVASPTPSAWAISLSPPCCNGWRPRTTAAAVREAQSPPGPLHHPRQLIGDDPLSSRIEGWWNSSNTDIDLVALDQIAQRLRLGSCKRSEVALVNDLGRFDGHVVRFLKAFPRFTDWQLEKVAIAPSLTPEAGRAVEAAGYLPQSLDDLKADLLPGGIAASP